MTHQVFGGGGTVLAAPPAATSGGSGAGVSLLWIMSCMLFALGVWGCESSPSFNRNEPPHASSAGCCIVAGGMHAEVSCGCRSSLSAWNRVQLPEVDKSD
eukprot:CAMPEP_0172881796 /NCGR_PEP_ID=MMETSP1075-20121228/118438_1 /TAXON_ID=2916 /ORGANISM="Ceratium fusus, Strain PA161109" /LENGTH=99 /DNA_ID=CAMNT_0013734337 /DNA_START=241 /DNA_END=540 /DNA_ORIENTATION=-